MDKKTRLAKAFNLETPDRPPILGGWLAAPGHIQTLTGCSDDDYWSNPFGWGLEAERVLGSDGVITIHEPVSRGEYRIVDGRVLEARARYTVDSVLAEIGTMPDPEELESSFDEEQEYKQFVAEFKARQAQCGDLLWCPADWDIVPQALWYGKFGYESALMTLALHPDRYRKLIQVSAVRGYQRAVLLARAMREGIAPRAFLTGEDLCGQRGPMLSRPVSCGRATLPTDGSSAWPESIRRRSSRMGVSWRVLCAPRLLPWRSRRGPRAHPRDRRVPSAMRDRHREGRDLTPNRLGKWS